MSNRGQSAVVEGFVLVRPNDEPYRGIDRTPFEPTIADDDLSEQRDGAMPTTRVSASDFAKESWRREAYRLFEDGSVCDEAGAVCLIRSNVTAELVLSKIQAQVGRYEILFARVFEMEDDSEIDVPIDTTFLGFDVAFRGGDYYSAVRNGMFTNPSDLLLAEFARALNLYGLFSSRDQCRKYLAAFRAVVRSEGKSDFVLYELYLRG